MKKVVLAGVLSMIVSGAAFADSVGTMYDSDTITATVVAPTTVSISCSNPSDLAEGAPQGTSFGSCTLHTDSATALSIAIKAAGDSVRTVKSGFGSAVNSDKSKEIVFDPIWPTGITPEWYNNQEAVGFGEISNAADIVVPFHTHTSIPSGSADVYTATVGVFSYTS